MNTYDGISIPMAIVDLIPVVLFFMAALLLLKDLYNKLYKGAYALLATGSIMVLTGGIFKALWKVLVALGICDFRARGVCRCSLRRCHHGIPSTEHLFRTGTPDKESFQGHRQGAQHLRTFQYPVSC